MTPELLCSICLPEEVGDWRIHRAIYQRRGNAGDPFELTYKIPRQVLPLSADDAEPWLIAGIMVAMEEGRNFHVGGRASRRLMAGLETVVAAWSEWRPEKYRRIHFSADTLTEDAEADNVSRGIIVPFSGGVDSSYTLWRHRLQRAGYQQQTVTHAVMIGGLDIPCGEEAAFERAFKIQASSLESSGLQLLPAFTNYREQISCKWIEHYGAVLISTLYFFKAECRAALIPASETLGPDGLGGGSNPITDPLFSGARLSVVHDGAEVTRPQKIKSLVQWGVKTRDLRVCWQNADRATNCGACEKCMRTRISFLVNGINPPDSLCRSDTEADIRHLKIKRVTYAAIYRDILTQARQNHVTAPWCSLLEKRLLRYYRKELFRRFVKTFFQS